MDRYITRTVLPASLLEEFCRKEDEYLWVEYILMEQGLIVDSIEQSIYRSYDDDKHKKYYSGKNKNRK